MAFIGCGACVSVVVNSNRWFSDRSITEGLETVVGFAIAVTGVAGFFGLTSVATSPSPTALTQRASAEAIIGGRQRTGGAQAERHERRVLEARAELGRQDIADGFRRYGDSNEASARWFLLVGVLIFAGSVAAAVWLVGRLGEGASVAAILTRAAITVPGAIVFGVFISEAAARRRYAAWGGLIAIQAEHLGAFTADMKEQDRNELEMQFARAVFRGGDIALDQGSQPRRHLLGRSGSGDDATTPPLKAITEVLGLTKSMAELAKSLHQVPEAHAKADEAGREASDPRL